MRPQACGVLKEICDIHVVDTTDHEVDHYEILLEATLRKVGRDDLVAVVSNGYAAGAAKIPYAW